MRAHDVDHGVTAKFSEMVGADHRVVVVFPYVIDARFKLDEIVNAGLPFRCPVHSTNDTAKRKSSGGIATGDLFERMQHSILIESSIAKVGFGRGSELKLASSLGRPSVDSRRDQASHMLAALIRINDVNGFVAASESVLNKGKEHAVLFFLAVKERTNVTGLRELGTRKSDRGRGLHDSIPP
jgi:hypothetical protein